VVTGSFASQTASEISHFGSNLAVKDADALLYQIRQKKCTFPRRLLRFAPSQMPFIP
jgi:hypothetical protein